MTDETFSDASKTAATEADRYTRAAEIASGARATAINHDVHPHYADAVYVQVFAETARKLHEAECEACRPMTLTVAVAHSRSRRLLTLTMLYVFSTALAVALIAAYASDDHLWGSTVCAVFALFNLWCAIDSAHRWWRS